MGGHVELVDRFVGRTELGRWLQAADIVVTPYPNLEKTVSGTLSHAMGAGKAIVSTPFPYASELLAGGRGVLAKPDPAALAAALIALLGDERRRRTLGGRAHAYSRDMLWPGVGSAIPGGLRAGDEDACGADPAAAAGVRPGLIFAPRAPVGGLYSRSLPDHSAGRRPWWP